MKQYASQRIKALKRIFDQFDSDGSGELDAEETKLMLQKLGFDPTDEDVLRVLSRADKNGNLCIGFDEFAAGCLDISDSNLYSGIKRRISNGYTLLDNFNSQYLDSRKNKGISRKVWTKADIERSLINNSSEESNLQVIKKPDIENQRQLVQDLENRLEEARKKLKDLEGNSVTLSKDAPQLLTGVLKYTNHANEIAKTLGKDCVFNARIFRDLSTEKDQVEVNMKTKHGSYYWSLDKFMERYAEMLNMIDYFRHCQEENLPYIDERPDELDPFADTDYQLIGQAAAWLKSLGNMMESSITTTILGPTGQRRGEMIVAILPCDKNGNPGPWDDDDENDPFVDSAENLLNTEILFRICITEVLFIEENDTNPYADIYVRYKFRYDDQDEIFSRTEKHKGDTAVCHYDYVEEHKIFVTQEVVEHLTNGRILFEVWGHLKSQKSNNLKRTTSAIVAVDKMEKLVEERRVSDAVIETLRRLSQSIPKVTIIEKPTFVESKDTNQIVKKSIPDNNATRERKEPQTDEEDQKVPILRNNLPAKLPVYSDEDENEQPMPSKMPHGTAKRAPEPKRLQQGGKTTPRQLGTLNVSLAV